MSSIYGFIAPRNMAKQGSTDLLDVMRDRLGHSSEDCLHSGTRTPGCALGCHRHSGTLFSGEDLQVAVTGRPWWSERSFQSIASEKGHAQAAAEAYRRLGTGLLQHLHGAFALAIFEPGSGHALIAVDRVGTQPLAFSAVDGTLVIASRADAILAHPDVSKVLDPQGLFNYLYFHMVPSPGSIYQGIKKAPPWRIPHVRQRDGNPLILLAA